MSIEELEKLLRTTESPNILLRPKFWLMGPSRFCTGFYNQFISSGSADEVYPGLWVGNKYAAESLEFLQARGISHVVNCAGGNQSGLIKFGTRGR